jgi:hypothetical protein
MDTNAEGGIVEPPDTIAAAGLTDVVEVVNSNISIYSKTNGSILLNSEGLDVFFSSVDSSDFLFSDVYVGYDELAGRFWVSTMDIDFANLVSYFDLAISKTSDPTKGWNTYQIDTTESSNLTPDGLFTDFPRVGWNADVYTVSWNMYDFDTQSIPFGVQIMTIQKSSVLNGSSIVDYKVDRPLPNQTMVPATMHDAQPGAPMWFVEEKGAETNGTFSNLRVVKMTNMLSNNPSFTDYYVPVNPYLAPPPPFDTLGQVTTALDSRILSADWQSGRLVACQDVGLPTDPNGDTHAAWYDLTTNGAAPSLLEQGAISPGAGIDTYMPSAALMENGTIGMTYIESSASENMSMYVTGRTLADPANTMEKGVLAKAGEMNYQGSRAGDFSYVNVDPATGTSFWAANEYAISTSDLSVPNWGTWIADFTLSGQSTGLAGAIYGPTTAVPGQTLTYRFWASEPVPADRQDEFLYNINWGDGQTSSVTDIDPSVNAHTYTAAGTYKIAVTITDQDGVVSPAAKLTVVIKPAVMEGSNLAVGGTTGNDTFAFSPGSAPGSVKVLVNGTSQGAFIPTGSVIMFGDGGSDSVTINGTSGADSFTVDPSDVVLNGLAYTADSSISGWKLAGLAGDDTFTFNGTGKATIDGGIGNNTIQGPNVTTVTTWQIKGPNSGVVGTSGFANIENLVGGSGNDIFKFSGTGTVTSINGGGGLNSLNYSLYGSTVSVNLQTKAATGVTTFANITSMLGSPQANTVTGRNVTNTWLITGANIAKVATFTFTGFQNLVGGSGMNVFKFTTAASSLSGSINGVGPGSWLDYSLLSIPVTVNLTTGTATGVTGGITNIQNVAGGSGGNNLTGNSQGNVLVGGSGNDSITGGSGASVLIGGLGSDSIVGGGGGNLIIGSSTSFDANRAALNSILAEWQRTDISFAQRVSDLRGPTGGLNGSNFLTPTTVPDNATGDTLTGGVGQNWFWCNSSANTITDFKTGTDVLN